MRHIGVVTLLVLTFAGTLASSANRPGLTRPDPASGATEVRLGLYVVDIAEIDDARQTMTVDLVVWSRWTDSRLADATAGLRDFPLTTVWNPQVLIANERTAVPKLPDRVYVEPDGTVLYAQRLYVEVSTRADFANFPFDRQNFRIHVIAGGYTRDEVTFTIEPTRTGRSEDLSVANWKVGALHAKSAPFEYTADARVFPGVVVELPATRHHRYYILKVIFPLVVVVLMSWTVFWIDPTYVAPQIGVSTTSILTLIAYQFVISGLVPKLSYLTRLDRFTIGSTVLVLLALVEVTVTISLATRERLDAAQRLDRWSRVAFPAAFAGVLVVAFAI